MTVVAMIRHAPTTWNDAGLIQGRTETALSEAGIAMARSWHVPAPLAGMLVHSLAETLAGLILVNLFAPGHPVVFSNWPFVIDLRTGGFSGSGGEISLLNAAAAQMAHHYDLPAGVAASMADAKIPDAQAGYEKAISTLATGLAGANLIYESAGMFASLMGASFEGFVIDAAVEALLQDDETPMSTVVHALPEDARDDPNRVKVVLDRAGFALYFSRSPVPYPRGPVAATWQHVGLYAYRRPFLLEFVDLPRTPAEQAEELEQLRVLEHGYRIRVAVVEGWHSVPVDVPEDVATVEARLR